MKKPKTIHETENCTLFVYGRPKPYSIPVRIKYKNFYIKFYKRKKMHIDSANIDQSKEENSIFYANINRLVILCIITVFTGFALYHHEKVKILETTVNGVSEVNASMASSISNISREKLKENTQ